MSKAILVIDKPKTCWLCLLCGRGIRERFCIAKIYTQGNTDNCDITELDKVLKDCPLKTLPPKIIDVLDDDTWQAGWNDCLDAIVGGKQ